MLVELPISPSKSFEYTTISKRRKSKIWRRRLNAIKFEKEALSSKSDPQINLSRYMLLTLQFKRTALSLSASSSHPLLAA